jgi:hypothetical protein
VSATTSARRCRATDICFDHEPFVREGLEEKVRLHDEESVSDEAKALSETVVSHSYAQGAGVRSPEE